MAQNGEQIGLGFFKKKRTRKKVDWHKMALYIALLLSIIWHTHSLKVSNQTLDLAEELIKSCLYW